jgi:CO/xanthine dehydrogenase FAD-binding subunit
MDYHRPQSLDEALTLLAQGVPLAGGTLITPGRREVAAVVDLQSLGLDTFRLEGGFVCAGAMLRLQTLVEAPVQLVPQALAAACRMEAGANLRRMATLGGTIFGARGRSPAACALLALGADGFSAPENVAVSLDALLDQRLAWPQGKLLTEMRWMPDTRLAFESVGRSPADRPIVCVAIGRDAAGWRVSVGGWGERPVLVAGAHTALVRGDLEAAGEASRQACAAADDAWASGEYRSEVAAVLTRRLAKEVMS